MERDLTERSKYERAELGQLGQPALDPAEATFQFIVTDLSGYSTGRGLLAQDASRTLGWKKANKVQTEMGSKPCRRC